MIASINKTKELLNKYNIQAKKRFGQNFLIDANVVKKITDTAHIDKNTSVVEIGPGLGSMTEELCQVAKNVICFEIDHDMVNILTNELPFDNLQIIEKDFLKANLNEYMSDKSDNNRTIVVSNLPYYITTPIVTKLLKEENVSEIYVMVQDEVARRLTGTKGSKDYGSLSVLISYYSIAKYEFKVSRNCFLPSPNVDSAIVSMKKIKNEHKPNNEAKFLNFVQNIFEMRRKTLINNLLKKYNIERDKIEEVLLKKGFDKNVRADCLCLEEIVDIFNELDALHI